LAAIIRARNALENGLSWTGRELLTISSSQAIIRGVEHMSRLERLSADSWVCRAGAAPTPQ
jgi:hypothetical protein